MSSTFDGRDEVAASLARAARVSAVVIGRLSLAKAQIFEVVVAGSSRDPDLTREGLAAQIARTVAPLVATRSKAGATVAPDGSGRDAERGRDGVRGRGAALWLASERCLVGVWPDPPAVTPFVALIGNGTEEVAAPWRRDLARVGLIYETERPRVPGADGADPLSTGGRAPHERGAGHEFAHDLLGLIEIGLVLCDRDGRTIYANAPAETWLGGSRALALTGGRLTGRRADVRSRLAAAIHTAAAGEPRAASALALPRTGGDPMPDMVTVMPFGLDGRALVVLGARESEVRSCDLALCALGLTAAERRLVGHLRRGRSLEEAACASEVTISTARTYLKRIFAKTGTHRQSELVALLAALSPPISVRGPLDIEPLVVAPSQFAGPRRAEPGRAVRLVRDRVQGRA